MRYWRKPCDARIFTPLPLTFRTEIRPMRTSSVLLLSLTGSLIVAGCNNSPVEVAPVSEAGFNTAGGGLVGSGNKSEADTTTAATDSDGGDSGAGEGRGGLVFGSGN